MLTYFFKSNQKMKKLKQSEKTKHYLDRKQSGNAIPTNIPAEILVLIDESGDLGTGPDSSKAIVMTASVNKNNRLVLDKIAKSHPKNTRFDGPDELKHYSSSDEVRRDVLVDFMRTSPQIYSVVLTKSNFGKMTQAKAYLKMVEEALDDIMEDPHVQACRVGVELVFDRHWAINDKIVQKMTQSAAKKHQLDETIFYARTEPSIDYPPLQVHDFATGTVGWEYNRIGGHNLNTPTKDYEIIAPRTKSRYISRNERMTVAPDLKTNRLPARSYFRLSGLWRSPRT